MTNLNKFGQFIKRYVDTDINHRIRYISVSCYGEIYDEKASILDWWKSACEDKEIRDGFVEQFRAECNEEMKELERQKMELDIWMGLTSEELFIE